MLSLSAFPAGKPASGWVTEELSALQLRGQLRLRR